MKDRLSAESRDAAGNWQLGLFLSALAKLLILDETGKPRSGWRAAIFLFAFTVAAVAFGTLGQILISTFAPGVLPGSAVYLSVNGLFSLIPAVLVGWLCGKLLERLPFRALGAAFTSGWWKHFLAGLIVGAATLGFAVSMAVAFGGLRFEVNAAACETIFRSLAVSFAVFAIAAAFEEALFRGYILQTFSRSGLAWLAILLTSVFFGAVHAGNPNANLISTANTVLAGIWFSVAYLKTRDLWFVWGVHLMWNWMQGSFFGIEVSGLTEITTTPLLKEIDSGPSWLTGTTYGIEGGIVCAIAIIVSIIALFYLPERMADEELVAMTSNPAIDN